MIFFGEMGLREGNKTKPDSTGPKMCRARSTPVYPEGTSASVEARLFSVQCAARSLIGVHVDSSISRFFRMQNSYTGENWWHWPRMC